MRADFWALLQQQQQIRNQKFNVRQQESVLALFKEFFERERLDAVQLKRFESGVYREQERLLQLTTSYQTQLDRYKISLGLPPDLEVVIEDDFLDRFNLVSNKVNERLISISRLRETTGSALNVVDKLFDDLDSLDDIENGKFPWPSTVDSLVEDLTPYLEEAEKH